MILQEPALVDFTGAEVIAAKNLDELVELYNCRDGQEKEGTFFSPVQFAEGAYFGIRDHGHLVAAAGTHLINRRESVAAVGNGGIFSTRKDPRRSAIIYWLSAIREARAPSPEYTQSSARFHPAPGHLLSSPSADRTHGHFC
jgi:hypothetical protein